MSERPRFKLNTPSLNLVIARRNSGKSHLVKWLLGNLVRRRKFSWVLVVAPTKFNGFWQTALDDEFIHPEFSPELLEKILTLQRDAKENGLANPGCLILDDCLGEANFQSDLFTRIASAGRHYELTVFATFQHYHKVPTVLRSNADYVFVMKAQNDRVFHALHEEYGLGFDTWQAVREYARAATENYGALVVDNLDSGQPVKMVRAPARLRGFRIRQEINAAGDSDSD